MVSDNVYHAQCVPAASLLLEASNGDPSIIPQRYLDNLQHVFVDGDISLAPAISKLDDIHSLEKEELEELIENLSKVNPEKFPDIHSILSIRCQDYFESSDCSALNFSEPNLGLSEKVEKCLLSCIGSVFGDTVHSIRDVKGKYPNADNNFLVQSDGAFSGTFSYDALTFLFEISPSKDGWVCTYRLSDKSLDNVPEPVRKKEQNQGTRKIRSQGWLS